MPIPLAKTSRRVTPGLVLKPQRDSPNWQAHACIRGKVHRRSTGTSDVKIAEQRALKWLSDLKTNPAAWPDPIERSSGYVSLILRLALVFEWPA